MMKKTVKKSTGKSITVPKGMKIEVEKEESASYKKKEKADKMKMMEKVVGKAVNKAMKKK
jgi:hypothetical protein